jgi:hypothetical protein
MTAIETNGLTIRRQHKRNNSDQYKNTSDSGSLGQLSTTLSSHNVDTVQLLCGE